MSLRLIGPLIAVVFAADTGFADNWPGFRGPRGDGTTAAANVPVKWSPTENVKWRIDLPLPGNSSPVVWGDRVFLSQPLDAKGHKRALWCLDRADGKKLWERVVSYAEDEPLHATNTFCAATPATDGQRVYVSFGSAGLYCYDFAGNERWHFDTGKQYHIWGNASSPVVYRDLVILWCGPGERQFLVALDKTSGKEVWRHDEPGGNFGKDNKSWLGSWSTPLVKTVNGRDELILGVPEKLKAFDPATGKELWSCGGLGKLVYTSPVCTDDGIVVAFSGYGGPALAVRAGGSGDVTAKRLWHHTRSHPQRIGSPVVIGDRCYLVNEDGIAHCFDATTGKDTWDRPSLGVKTWSSLTLADGKFYLADMNGSVHVLAATPAFEVLARNRLNGADDATRATVTAADGEIYLRTFKNLWCISGKAK